jgi:3-carboxy-cis,cis-muconate cycloisomerase
MPASPADSAIYRKLFSDPEIAQLFTDSAEVRAMMLVEGALAKVQGQLGLIPEVSGFAIHRASLELQIDPGGLADSVAENAVPVPELVRLFRDEMQAPEHAAFVHWGATSQDIMDTALALRLRQALTIVDARLSITIRALGDLAETTADATMVARTYGQAAVPTTFGALVASWGNPLIRHRSRLTIVREETRIVSLSGAAGTSAALGDAAPKVRAGLADALGLVDPGQSWHSSRDAFAALAGWLTGLTGTLGKMGADLQVLTQAGIDELKLEGGGASSTMPQKSNPVAPSVLSAIATQMVGLNSVMQAAMSHRLQRDGAAWLAEWMSLPQMVILAGRAIAIAEELASSIRPDPRAMTRLVDATDGMILAEALVFELSGRMPRPEAQDALKDMIANARENHRTLGEVALEAFPDLDPAFFDAGRHVGQAPEEARAFAKLARAAGK